MSPSPFRITVIAASVAVTGLAAFAQMRTVVRLAAVTVPAGTPEKTVSVDVRGTRAELLAAARSRQQDVTLELDVEAERSPDVFYEVSLSVPKGKRHAVGNVVLFGAGIRSEARGEFHPAHVQLIISDQLAAALGNRPAATLSITFTARGAARVPAAALMIDKAEIVVGPRLRQ